LEDVVPPEWRPWTVPPSQKTFKKLRKNISNTLGETFCFLAADMLKRLEADEAINKIMRNKVRFQK
jgi:hypothetical protein